MSNLQQFKDYVTSYMSMLMGTSEIDETHAARMEHAITNASSFADLPLAIHRIYASTMRIDKTVQSIQLQDKIYRELLTLCTIYMIMDKISFTPTLIDSPCAPTVSMEAALHEIDSTQQLRQDAIEKIRDMAAELDNIQPPKVKDQRMANFLETTSRLDKTYAAELLGMLNAAKKL